VPAPIGVKKNMGTTLKMRKTQSNFVKTHTKSDRKKKNMKEDQVSSPVLCIRGKDYIETRIDKNNNKYLYLSRRCVFRSEDVNGVELPQIRSMFVYDTKKKNVYSILVVAATPYRNYKDNIVVRTSRYMYKVNIQTGNVWIKLTKTQNSFFVPPGSWRTDEWKQSVVTNTKKALGLII